MLILQFYCVTLRDNKESSHRDHVWIIKSISWPHVTQKKILIIDTKPLLKLSLNTITLFNTHIHRGLKTDTEFQTTRGHSTELYTALRHTTIIKTTDLFFCSFPQSGQLRFSSTKSHSVLFLYIYNMSKDNTEITVWSRSDPEG